MCPFCCAIVIEDFFDSSCDNEMRDDNDDWDWGCWRCVFE